MILSRYFIATLISRSNPSFCQISLLSLSSKLSCKTQQLCSPPLTAASQIVTRQELNLCSEKKMYAPRPPCDVGDSITDVETPCLIVCMDKLEKNLEKMARTMQQSYPGIAVRPHAKAHKCAALGRKQIQNGAVGLCCQTLSEAEAMVEGGIQDILVSNQVIGKKKARRLAALAQAAKMSVCVDDGKNIQDLSEAASHLGVNLDLVIEVNVGQDRCGVEPGQDVPRLAEQILALPGIHFKGLQCYNGWNQHIRNFSERKAAVALVGEKSRKAMQLLKDAGIECSYVTGGGTGSFVFEAESGVFTEVQPGSYVFMDADYNKNFNQEGTNLQDFDQSLYLLATVQSISGADRAVLDAGLKAVSIDSGLPLVRSAGGVQTFHNGGDEHGILRPRGDLDIGKQVWLVPGHCDPTVNLHDWLVGLRDGKVECIWRVGARGPGV